MSRKAPGLVHKGAFLGVYRGKTMLNSTYCDFKLDNPDTVNFLEYELSIESYASGALVYKLGELAQEHGIVFDGYDPHNVDDNAMMVSAYGCGNITCVINDPHIEPYSKENKEEVGHCNTVMREVMVGGWPHLVLFANKKIKKGEELRYSYGNAFWSFVKDGVHRLEKQERLMDARQAAAAAAAAAVVPPSMAMAVALMMMAGVTPRQRLQVNGAAGAAAAAPVLAVRAASATSAEGFMDVVVEEEGEVVEDQREQQQTGKRKGNNSNGDYSRIYANGNGGINAAAVVATPQPPSSTITTTTTTAVQTVQQQQQQQRQESLPISTDGCRRRRFSGKTPQGKASKPDGMVTSSPVVLPLQQQQQHQYHAEVGEEEENEKENEEVENEMGEEEEEQLQQQQQTPMPTEEIEIDVTGGEEVDGGGTGGGDNQNAESNEENVEENVAVTVDAAAVAAALLPSEEPGINAEHILRDDLRAARKVLKKREKSLKNVDHVLNAKRQHNEEEKSWESREEYEEALDLQRLKMKDKDSALEAVHEATMALEVFLEDNEAAAGGGGGGGGPTSPSPRKRQRRSDDATSPRASKKRAKQSNRLMQNLDANGDATTSSAHKAQPLQNGQPGGGGDGVAHGATYDDDGVEIIDLT